MPRKSRNGANPFAYLTERMRRAAELKQHPPEWMPWNCRDTLGGSPCPLPRNIMNPA